MTRLESDGILNRSAHMELASRNPASNASYSASLLVGLNLRMSA